MCQCTKCQDNRKRSLKFNKLQLAVCYTNFKIYRAKPIKIYRAKQDAYTPILDNLMFFLGKIGRKK